MITGEVGAGEIIPVRAALAALDTSRHTTIYLAGVGPSHAQVDQQLGH